MNYSEQAKICKGLAHPVRLHILSLLRSGEVCVCHIERALDRRQAYVSQQLMVLRDAGWVETRKDGVQVFYRLANAHLAHLLECLLGAEILPNQRLEGCACPLCATIPAATIDG